MNTQEQIIALLQGELRNRTQTIELLRRLASSSEELDTFLKHIQLSRQASRLAQGAIITPASTRRAVRDHINGLDSSRERVLPALQKTPVLLFAPSSKYFPLSLLIGVGLLITILGTTTGYMIGLQRGTGDNIPQGGYAVVSTPAADADAPRYDDEKKKEEQPKHLLSKKMERITSKTYASSPVSLRAPIERPEQGREKKSADELQSAPPSPTQPPLITLLTPRGGERFQPDDIVPVAWSGTPSGSSITIEVSADAGMTWKPIAENVADTRFLWPIPDTAAAGSQYLLRVAPVISNEQTSFPLGLLSADTTGITLDISPDGTQIATAGRTEEVMLWDRKSGVPVAVMTGHTGSIMSCRYNFDGSRLVTAAMDGRAIIWNVQTGTIEHILDAGKGPNVWCAAFSPDGATVATAHDSGLVILWDASSGAQRDTLQIHQEGVRYVEFTPDGTRLLTTSTDRTAAITDLKSGTLLHRFTHNTITRYVGNPSKEGMRNAIVNSIQLMPDESVAITAGYDGYVRFWDAASGKLIRSAIYNGGTHVSMIALSPDGRNLLSLGSDGRMVLIDPQTGGIKGYRSLKNADTATPMIHAAFGPDPGIVAVSHSDGHVSTWDISQSAVLSDNFWSVGKQK